MSEPCAVCGSRNLVEVLLPERYERIAVACLACAWIQPVGADA